jgi:hypothetical protein
VLTDLAEASAQANVETLPLFDNDHHNYLLLDVGWDGLRRIHLIICSCFRSSLACGAQQGRVVGGQGSVNQVITRRNDERLSCLKRSLYGFVGNEQRSERRRAYSSVVGDKHSSQASGQRITADRHG